MLFNSVEFIFLFLPVCLLVFTLLEKKWGRVPALVSLIAASAYFYASWNPLYLVILAVSVFGNYAAGYLIQVIGNERLRKLVLALTIVGNLALLYYFKYFVFTLDLLHILPMPTDNRFLHQHALPLGISFWTFQQINFLLERYNRRKDSLHLLDYVSIVMFFPHLIAGPIVRTAELGPQVRAVGSRERNVTADISVGIIIFMAGLVKKVLIADVISVFPAKLYQMPHGEVMSMAGPVFAWFSIFAYMLQLYFDFSGYCDMGMGLARMFGFTFPINFNSPLQSRSFVSFWRTWHMTLTRFFTDTLHMPVAMHLMRRYSHLKSETLKSLITIGVPVLATFFLTGIWHGAGNQFVVFGLLNGIFMATGVVLSQEKIYIRNVWAAKLLTFMLVSITFIFFRTPNLHMGIEVFSCLFHIPHLADLQKWYGFVSDNRLASFVAGGALVVALGLPNLYQVMARYHAPIGFKAQKDGQYRIGAWTIPVHLRIDGWLGAIVALTLFVALYQLLRGGAVEFLYFQF